MYTDCLCEQLFSVIFSSLLESLEQAEKQISIPSVLSLHKKTGIEMRPGDLAHPTLFFVLLCIALTTNPYKD